MFTLPLKSAGIPVLVQTNAAGDNVTLIDMTTDKIIGEIYGVEVPHGAFASPDGTRLYISNESKHTVAVADLKTLKIIKSIPLTARPNKLSITNDGKKVYVAITGAAGGVDVIDTDKMERVKFIPILRGVHNTIMTPDAKHVVAGSTGGWNTTVIDTTTDQAIWGVHYGVGVRPFCFEKNPKDGTTKRMFVQLAGLHGFAVVDWNLRKEVQRITLPDIPVEQRNTEGIQGAPSHGCGVDPTGKTVWHTSKINSAVYAYSIPDLKYLGEVKTGLVPDWLTFSPDGKKLYVANAHDNTVSVIDVPNRKEITRIKVGQVPKRNSTAILPSLPTTSN
jgi:YVTN family beta-propeller protein